MVDNHKGSPLDNIVVGEKRQKERESKGCITLWQMSQTGNIELDPNDGQFFSTVEWSMVFASVYLYSMVFIGSIPLVKRWNSSDGQILGW